MQKNQTKKIAFIACSKTKRNLQCEAKEMYQGSLFKKSLNYCSKNFDVVYILSAKYGLLSLNDTIDPYELTLNRMKTEERKEWSRKVKKQMQKLKMKGEFSFFTGSKYHEFFEGQKPLLGLSLGRQLKWFNQKTKEKGLGLLP